METDDNENRKKQAQLAVEKRREVMRLLSQLLHGLNSRGGAGVEFQQNTEIVRLAIELARLRGRVSPFPFLEESAWLLTEARLALQWERARPEREQEEAHEKLVQDIAAELQETNVPFTRLCRPATEDEKVGSGSVAAHETFSAKTIDNKPVSFDWRVYRDERDLKELLEKHAKRIYHTTREKLNPLSNGPDRTGQPSITKAAKAPREWAEIALAELRNRYWLPDEWRNKFLGVKSLKAAAAVLNGYVAAATKVFAEQLWQDAKAGELNVPTLHSIYQTRAETYRTRGPKRVPSHRRKPA